MGKTETQAIGEDVIGISTHHAVSNVVSYDEIASRCRKAWNRYGATHFADATLAGVSLMVEKGASQEALRNFLEEAMAANDRLQTARAA